MIEIPKTPYNCDFVTDFTDNIYDYIHDKWYKTDRIMYNKYDDLLNNCIRIKDFRERLAELYKLRKELLNG